MSPSIQIAKLEAVVRDLENHHNILADSVSIAWGALFGVIAEYLVDLLAGRLVGIIAMGTMFFITFQAGQRIYKR